VRRGIFPALLDEELGVALLFGPMMFKHIIGPSMDREWLAKGTVEAFWKAHAWQGKKVAIEQWPVASDDPARTTGKMPRARRKK
jgi:hypothetical protein